MDVYQLLEKGEVEEEEEEVGKEEKQQPEDSRSARGSGLGLVHQRREQVEGSHASSAAAADGRATSAPSWGFASWRQTWHVAGTLPVPEVPCGGEQSTEPLASWRGGHLEHLCRRQLLLKNIATLCPLLTFTSPVENTQ